MYTSELEELRRYTIWQGKRAFVKEHNLNADKFGYRLKINQFSDLEMDEIRVQYKGLKHEHVTSSPNGTKYFKPSGDFKPLDTADWREKGAVTPVKNQGQCGSCWAFSATGAIEGQHFLATGELVSVSEQDLVDCSGDYGNDGCSGGFPYKAFQYVKDNGGIDTEESYPYTAADGMCKFSSSSVGATVTGYVKIPSGDESSLLEAVTSVGPISVSIDASHDSFHLYNSGVYYEPLCSTSMLDHAVLVVGYGTESGTDYWLVKNSWGEDWGLSGYLKMSRNKNNNCGIAARAVYPTV